MKKRKWKNFLLSLFHVWLRYIFGGRFYNIFMAGARKKKVRMRVVYLSVGWTYWHAKYSLLEQEWTSASWLLAWPLSYVFTEKIPGEKYSGITVISNITIKTPAFILNLLKVCQTHELIILEIMTYDWQTGFATILPLPEIVQTDKAQQQSFLGITTSNKM